MQQVNRWLRKTTATGQPPASASPGTMRLPSAEELAAFGRQEAVRLAVARRTAVQAQFERALGRAGIPRRFAGHDFASYQATLPEQRTALAVCRHYAERFAEAAADGRCLLLVGGPGTGKTHLACAILAEVIRAGHTGLFMSVSAALRTLRDAYSPRPERTEAQAFALLTAPELLVLDEVGMDIGEPQKRKAMLFDLLNERYADQRPTILIGNLTAAELEGCLGERTLDRLLDTGSVVPFTWASYRRGARDV